MYYQIYSPKKFAGIATQAGFTLVQPISQPIMHYGQLQDCQDGFHVLQGMDRFWSFKTSACNYEVAFANYYVRLEAQQQRSVAAAMLGFIDNFAFKSIGITFAKNDQEISISTQDLSKHVTVSRTVCASLDLCQQLLLNRQVDRKTFDLVRMHQSNGASLV